MSKVHGSHVIEVLSSLPALPVVQAQDMLHAQGYQPSSSESAVIRSYGDVFESLGVSRSVSLQVRDFHGSHIGFLSFSGSLS